jgi:hypothetical protein
MKTITEQSEKSKSKHTKQEKQEYFKRLRDRWLTAKKLLDDSKISEIQAIIATHGLNISVSGFMFVSIQMRQQGLDGLPYLDAKTYKGWRENGFQVRKGEKSNLSGITWLPVVSGKVTGKLGDEEITVDTCDYMMPKEYHLFHRNQVEAA